MRVTSVLDESLRIDELTLDLWVQQIFIGMTSFLTSLLTSVTTCVSDNVLLISMVFNNNTDH